MGPQPRDFKRGCDCSPPEKRKAGGPAFPCFAFSGRGGRWPYYVFGSVLALCSFFCFLLCFFSDFAGLPEGAGAVAAGAGVPEVCAATGSAAPAKEASIRTAISFFMCDSCLKRECPYWTRTQ